MNVYYVSLVHDLLGCFLVFQAESETAVREYLASKYLLPDGNWKLPWCSVYDHNPLLKYPHAKLIMAPVEPLRSPVRRQPIDCTEAQEQQEKVATVGPADKRHLYKTARLVTQSHSLKSGTPVSVAYVGYTNGHHRFACDIAGDVITKMESELYDFVL